MIFIKFIIMSTGLHLNDYKLFNSEVCLCGGVLCIFLGESLVPFQYDDIHTADMIIAPCQSAVRGGSCARKKTGVHLPLSSAHGKNTAGYCLRPLPQ